MCERERECVFVCARAHTGVCVCVCVCVNAHTVNLVKYQLFRLSWYHAFVLEREREGWV